MDCLGEILTGEMHEDFVEYFVFPDLPSGTGTEGSEEDLEIKLSEILYSLNAEAVNLMDEYLWHKDPFTLRRPPGELYFHGMTRFGENVDDEWFIVYILQKLTILFPKLVVRVIDNDGEFPLIEAAEFLPRWAESDTKCRKRVYLYDGKVHLIPLSAFQKNDPTGSGVPEVSEAIKLVRDDNIMTIASDGIQKAIHDRIGDYPARMFTNFHHANLVLPPRLAMILKSRPDLVAPAVQAFYNRDPIDMQAARLMKNFKPGDSLVKTRVRFTRTLYAMLSKQDYRPDPKTGWGLPRPTSKDFKAHCLGAKLTTGFEILLAGSNIKQKVDPNDPLDAHFSTQAWHMYEDKLKKTGYYKDFLEGSKPHEELKERAKRFYAANLTNGEINPHPNDAADLIVQQIKYLMTTVPVEFEKLKKEGFSLPPEDDDAWLDIKPDDLETLLEEQFKTKITDQKLDQIPDKLREFMNNLSAYDGVDDPAPTLGGYFSNPMNGDNDQDGEMELVDFRANDFVSAMDKLLVELGKPDRDWEASDEDSFSDEERATIEDVKRMHDFNKDSKIHQLMGQMDAELAETDVGKTFTNNSGSGSDPCQPSTSAAARAHIEEIDQFDREVEPLDLDMNALANMLESFHAQDGPSGPSANLLRSVGFDITKAKK